MRSRSVLPDSLQPNRLQPGSSVHGILQARILERGALPFEPACQRRRHKIHGLDPWVGKIPWRRAGQLTPVFLVAQLCPFAAPWTAAHPATGPLSTAFPRQEYWSGGHFLPHGIFPTQGWNLGLLHCRRILYQLSHQENPGMWEYQDTICA